MRSRSRSRYIFLYSSGSSGVPPRARHLVGELDHLVHGLLAGQTPDEIFDHGAQLGLGFAGLQIDQNLDHHGDHHVHPAGADQREGAVEIEEHNFGMGGRGAGRIVSIMG